MLELEGRVAVVTGGSRGLGKAISLKLSQNGARVAVNYREREAEALAVVAAAAAHGGEAMAVAADIREGEAVKAMFSRVVEEWGKVDILVNNAGITRDELILRMSESSWDDVLAINLRGAYLCTKAALRSMLTQKWGRVVNIASIAGVVGNAGQANYSASKGGLIAFTKSVAREVASRNITANAVAPGFITTELTDRLLRERGQAILPTIPLRRFGKPEDVAELVAFLAGDRAGYITGQVINVDGGMT